MGDDGEVARFLSSEWIERLAERSATASRPRTAPDGEASDSPVTVLIRVTGGPEGDVEYLARFQAGGVQITADPPRNPTAQVLVVQDYATAADISRGELTPASAFASGRMKVGGQVGLMVQHRDALALLGDVFAALRAETKY